VRGRPWGWIAVVCAALVAGLLAGRTVAPTADSRAATKPATRTAVIPTVGVGQPKYENLPVTLQLTASIASLREAVLLPKTSGYLQQVNVRAGDTVTAGQVLALIDHSALDSQVAQSQASLAAAGTGVQTSEASLAAARAQGLNSVAALRSAEAQLNNSRAGLTKAQAALADAQVTYNRTASLVQQGAVAQQNLDDARAAVISDQAAVDQAAAQIRVSEAQVAQARAMVDASTQQTAAAASQVRTQQAQVASQAAALQNSQIQLGYATVVAPFDGVVVSRSLDPGAYVTPGTSTPILTIADLDHLYVAVNVTETQLGMLHRGDRVQMLVDAFPGRTFAGVVSRIAGGVDPQTRTVETEIDVTNPGRLLRPGMYATAELSAGTQRALVVPLSALVTVGSLHYVWAVVDGRTSQRQVTVGRATGDVVEVTSGINASDTVVFRGTDQVRDSQQVHSTPVGF